MFSKFLEMFKAKPIEKLDYYANGQMACRYYLIRGKKSGEQKWWDVNGNLKEQCFYLNGKLHGEYKFWLSDGTLKEQDFYVHGKTDGEYKKWFNNGQLQIHCFYVDGHRTGEYKRWLANGDLVVHCFYQNDRLHGEYKFWDKKLFDSPLYHNLYVKGHDVTDVVLEKYKALYLNDLTEEQNEEIQIMLKKGCSYKLFVL